MKPLKFVGSSLEDLKNFPDEARRAAGFELDAIQRGLAPSDWKPMKSVGTGVYEIRLHILGEWRIIYAAKFREAIYVLHSFQKKSQKHERPISILHDNVINRLEANHERKNHQFLWQRIQ
jgi:phage-related protein